MIGESLRINGSSRVRAMIVVLLSTKLELSQNIFDKIKVLTMMRFSHSYRCLKVYPNHVSSCCIIYEILHVGCQKHCFLDGLLEERLYVIQPEGFVDPKDTNKYASSTDPSVDWCKHLGVGIHALIK